MTDDNAWLHAALPAVASFIDFQMRQSQQVGCSIAIAHRGQIVLEKSFGLADASTDEQLTPRHTFRVASHSKSFCASGMMKLRELGMLSLDDQIGKYVDGLHPDAAKATISQLLSHTAGLTRDGPDGGQFSDTRTYLNKEELVEQLMDKPPIDSASRVKYSNHGFGLLGFIISRITNSPFNTWISREIVAPIGLTETYPDFALKPESTPFARGHTARALLGSRLPIPADNTTNDMASATGFVSTPSDLAKFFSALSPSSDSSPLSPTTRREMTRRHWKIPHLSPEQYYGLGTSSGNIGDWAWFGHGGAFQGVLSKTACIPAHKVSISVIVNALDGTPDGWLEGIVYLLQAYQKRGAPEEEIAGWAGRFWSLWGCVDLLPMGAKKVLVGRPALMNPLVDATEIEVTGVDEGLISEAGGYGSYGEKVRIVRGADGKITEVWLGGSRNVPEDVLVEEVKARYGKAG